MRLHNGNRGVQGGNEFWDYTEVDFKDANLLETAQKVSVFIAANNAKWSSVDKGAGVETVDGRILKETVTFAKGLPENPMTPGEIDEKFCYLVEAVMEKGIPRAIIGKVKTIEKVRDIGEIVNLLVVKSNPRC